MTIAFDRGWLVLPLAANAGGAVGDVWTTLTSLGYPDHVHVEDHRTGIHILARAEDRARELSVATVVWDALVGAAVASVGLLALITFGGRFVLDAPNVGSSTLDTPGTVPYAFSYPNTPGEIAIGIGLGVPIVGGVLDRCPRSSDPSGACGARWIRLHVEPTSSRGPSPDCRGGF